MSAGAGCRAPPLQEGALQWGAAWSRMPGSEGSLQPPHAGMDSCRRCSAQWSSRCCCSRRCCSRCACCSRSCCCSTMPSPGLEPRPGAPCRTSWLATAVAGVGGELQPEKQAVARGGRPPREQLEELPPQVPPWKSASPGQSGQLSTNVAPWKSPSPGQSSTSTCRVLHTKHTGSDEVKGSMLLVRASSGSANSKTSSKEQNQQLVMPLGTGTPIQDHTRF